jgi:hypothetical protein
MTWDDLWLLWPTLCALAWGLEWVLTRRRE